MLVQYLHRLNKNYVFLFLYFVLAKCFFRIEIHASVNKQCGGRSLAALTEVLISHSKV